MPTLSGLVRQSAAIPLKDGKVCVVSSRSGKRWVIPKGCLEPGKSSGEIALQESWEEAGLVGLLAPEPVGTYLYEKAGLTFHVTVFLLHVTEVAEEFPEREMRKRLWLTPQQAVLRVEDTGLREVLRGVFFGKSST